MRIDSIAIRKHFLFKGSFIDLLGEKAFVVYRIISDNFGYTTEFQVYVGPITEFKLSVDDYNRWYENGTRTERADQIGQMVFEHLETH